MPATTERPTDHDAVLRGMRLHYLDWGSAGEPPVLLLHGGCLTAHTWDGVCDELRGEVRCLALDQRGHGDSEWSPTGDYRTEAFAGDLAALIEHIGLRRPVLVGHSLGGMNAIAYAAERPDALAGLVLVDVGGEVDWSGADRIVDFVRGGAVLDSLDAFVERARAFHPGRDPDVLRTSLLHNLRQLPDGRWTWKYDHRGIVATVGDMRDKIAAMRAQIPALACPTLVVRGERSDVLSEDAARAVAAELPDGRLATVPDAGHAVQGDNPAGLAAVLRDFLAELTCSGVDDPRWAFSQAFRSLGT